MHMATERRRHAVAAVAIFSLCTAVLGYSEDCSHSQSGIARLAGYNSSYIGIIQVCREGYWTTISFEDENEWTRKNSIVACKELGFNGAVGIMMRDVSQETATGGKFNSLSPQEYYSVECSGLEEYLVDCSWSIRTMKSKRMDVMVMCRQEPSAGEVAVVGVSGKDNKGVVVMYNPLKTYSWSAICTTQWDDQDAAVVCRQLGYQGGVSTAYSSEEEVRSKHLPRKRYSSFECLGSESRLSNCSFRGPYPYQCGSQMYAGVVCSTGDANDDTILNLNITLLAFMIIISVLLIIILSLLLKCTLNKFKKTPATHGNQMESSGANGRGPGPSIIRTNLDHEMPYALLPTIAPPSYQDTLLADQVVQTEPHQVATSPTEEGSDLSSSTELLVNDTGSSAQDPPPYIETIA